MENISTIMPINISSKPKIVENFMIVANRSPKEVENFKEFHKMFSWSYKEMPNINPSIVKHEINTYDNVKPIQ
jgi:hypothetical protein